MSGHILVGVDGSGPSLAALDLAVAEAGLHKAPLHVVHAYRWPTSAGIPDDAMRRQAKGFVTDAVKHARDADPALDVTGELVTGYPEPVLAGLSKGARMVVLGDRGLGGVGSLLAGSVAVEVAAKADCPVLVARGSSDAAGEIVLGVDGSPANRPAIGFAFAEAAARGCGIVGIHVWSEPMSTGPGGMLPLVYDPALLEADEERLLVEALAGWCSLYPQVTVVRRLLRGHARPTLIDATARARMIVVGARGRGALAGLVLGSVSQAVLHHAACPVAIVPEASSA
jgi:nucleotide-binding universal stress UspA family protein